MFIHTPMPPVRIVRFLLVAGVCACTKTPGGSDEQHIDTGSVGDGHTVAVVTTVAGDYSTGTFATVDLDDLSVHDELFISSGDPVVVADDGHIFQINRLGYDNVRRYTPGSWVEPVWEQSVGENANPHDANVCGGSLFVSLYDRDYIGVYDLDMGILTGTVDLSEFNDGDDQGPEASRLIEVNGRLYAGLNRMNRNDDWNSAGGVVVEIDCSTHSVTRSWDVGGGAQIYAWPERDQILVTTDATDDAAAGLFAIDPSTDDVATIVDTGDEHLVGLAASGDSAIGISVAADYSHYAIHCIDLASGTWSTAEETSSFLTGVYGNDRGEAWITSGRPWIDLDAPSGVFIYDIESCTSIRDAPLTFSLYPYSLAFY